VATEDTMRHQRLTWWCGPASISNALYAIGISKDQEEIAKLCHVTKNGTNEDEMIRGVLASGAKAAPWSSRHKLKSWQWLQSTLWDHGPAILCVDHDQHWVTAVGILNQTTVWLFDPATGFGWKRYDLGELMARWRLGTHRGGPWYYGIGVSK
jgi:ABC-type bacteriocin/lantibiotic exporter with double-glycine peptidase domain